MSDELYEVAFSGQIKVDADLEHVKAKVAAMFKADEAKLARLFSGQRMVIKKNIDQATAKKYQMALDNAGAVCEVKSLTEAVGAVSVTERPVRSTGVSEAPQTDPLGISAEDIDTLSADIAPVGSDMQDEIKTVAEPELDLSGMDMAPAGSDLGQIKKGEDPEPPNTDGLSLAD